MLNFEDAENNHLQFDKPGERKNREFSFNVQEEEEKKSTGFNFEENKADKFISDQKKGSITSSGGSDASGRLLSVGDDALEIAGSHRKNSSNVNSVQTAIGETETILQ